MRTKNSIQNSLIAVISNIIIIILGFVVQKLFLVFLNEEYLGINGLFNNVVSMLAIVELGIGPAIVSNLYKPLAENNKEAIKSLLAYYKKCYYIIGIIVLIVGLLILPFLNLFVNTTLTFNNFGGLYFIFLLYVFDSSFSYFYSYKRSIIQADQKNRIINLVHVICYTVMSVLQVILLAITKNFILFLVVKIVLRLIENIVLSIIADRLYSYLKDDYQEITDTEKKSIFKKVKGLIFHKVGGYIVLGTDNIIISKFLGVALVGLYSNYYLIINSLHTLISQVFGAITASVGSLLATSDNDKNYDVYKKIMFVNFWIYGVASVAVFCIMNPFITLVFGEQYLLPMNVLAILVINFYMLGMRLSLGTFKDAAGIFYEDRYIPIMESIINIVASIILVYIYGMFGVFLGTFISSLLVVFYSLPHYVFEKVFERKKREYYKLYFKYVLVALIGFFMTYIPYIYVCQMLSLSTLFKLIVSTVMCTLVPNIIYILIFRKSEEYLYFKQYLFGLLKRRV